MHVVSINSFLCIHCSLLLSMMTEQGKRNVKSALCEIVLPVISLSVSSTDQEDADEFDSPLRFVQL